MEEENDIPENSLAKWLAGDLTPSELQAFEQTADFKLYLKIAEETGKLELPKVDLKEKFAQQLAYNKTLKQSANKSKVRSLRPWMYAAAATIAILLGAYVFFDQETVITADYAENRMVILPDSSVVVLNAGSELRYDANKFLGKRKLRLAGEAYFTVKKGSFFEVGTANGSIKVLGTRFNVYAREKLLKVFCDEGKVAVFVNKDSLTLTKGMSAIATAESVLRLSSKETESPKWRTGESRFVKESLEEVFLEMERQYNVKIDGSRINKQRSYTGSFQNNDLINALNRVCGPMDLKFDVVDDKVLLQPK